MRPANLIESRCVIKLRLHLLCNPINAVGGLFRHDLQSGSRPSELSQVSSILSPKSPSKSHRDLKGDLGSFGDAALSSGFVGRA